MGATRESETDCPLVPSGGGVLAEIVLWATGPGVLPKKPVMDANDRPTRLNRDYRKQTPIG